MIGPTRLMLPKIALLTAGLAGAFAVYGQEDPYYDGKTVTLYVGRTPGSGADLHVRVFAEFWRRFIPGEPTIVVRNMPGGGGTRVGRALNELGVFIPSTNPNAPGAEDASARLRTLYMGSYRGGPQADYVRDLITIAGTENFRVTLQVRTGTDVDALKQDLARSLADYGHAKLSRSLGGAFVAVLQAQDLVAEAILRRSAHAQKHAADAAAAEADERNGAARVERARSRSGGNGDGAPTQHR